MDLLVLVTDRVDREHVGDVVVAVDKAVADLGLRSRTEHLRTGIGGGSLDALVRESGASHVLVIGLALDDLTDRIGQLWGRRDGGDILVSSRYSDDRGTRPKELRRERERYADRWLARILTLDTADVRTPLQLLRASALLDLAVRGVDVADPIDVCVKAAVAGWRTVEVRKPYWPLFSRQPDPPAGPGLRGTYRHWVERNGIDSADYDMRAFNSRIPPQRAWQRRRHAVTYDLVGGHTGRGVLNVGAGSGRLALDLPGSVSVDIVHAKLRYMRKYAANRLTTASIFQLPFPDARFECVVCCEVIEHVPREPSAIAELVRVLRPGGRLVLSTPDYGTAVWPTIERVYGAVQPHGYADEHITHYTEQSLVEEAAEHGLRVIDVQRVYRAILVAAFERVA